MISVIIPIYNEEKGIARCIDTILPQISAEDEVIVVSSGSTDGTVAEVCKIADERVRLIIQKERKGKASAINLAVKRAKGDICVQTDGDLELLSDSITYIIKPFEDPKVGSVSGHPLPIIEEGNLFYEWTNMSYEKIHQLRLDEDKEEKFWHLSGYLLAFRKEALACGLPEDKKGAIDAWMGKIIKDGGWKIRYAHDAFVMVKAPTTIKDFIIQKARVRAGYAVLPNMPRSVGSEISSFPKELFRISILRWPAFITCAFIYAWCWIKAKFIKGKSLNEVWQIPESTK